MRSSRQCTYLPPSVLSLPARGWKWLTRTGAIALSGRGSPLRRRPSPRGHSLPSPAVGGAGGGGTVEISHEGRPIPTQRANHNLHRAIASHQCGAKGLRLTQSPSRVNSGTCSTPGERVVLRGTLPVCSTLRWPATLAPTAAQGADHDASCDLRISSPTRIPRPLR